jgi:multicomponent Na+:H+ antiporter subunit D
VDVPSVLPAVALLPSALAVPLIVLSRGRPAIRETWSLLAAVTQTLIVAAMVPVALSGVAPTSRPLGLVSSIPLELRADPAGVFFALVASALWILTTIYSIGYTRAEGERRQTRYFAAFAACLCATVGIALAGNLPTFYVFYELLTVAGYPLVIHRETPEAVRAGRVYLAYTLGGGVALLAAVAWTVTLTGRAGFVAGGFLDAAGASPAALWALFALFVAGCGVKAAVLPLHTWLPLAMVAPTPVSALLHAVAVVKAGVFGLVRVTGFVFGTELLGDLGAGPALAWLAAATIVLASLAALAQDNLKRLLAFSTIGQLAYVVLGVALGPRDAFTGGVMHMASHALMKITLFFCAGAIAVTAHLDRVSQLTGIGRRMPLTMGAFALAAFMLAGLPPGAGFVSKWLLLLGGVEASAWIGVAALLASTLLNIAYFAPIVVRAWMAPASPAPVTEAPATMLVPLLVTAVAALVVGLAPDALAPLLSLARAAAGAP